MPTIIIKAFLVISIVFYVPFISANMEIIKLHPEPNYRLTMSSSDADDLVDNNINNYPIWTKKSSVGWQFKTPILIHMNMNLDAKCLNDASGVLSVHTARGDLAGVSLPRRLDVYSKVNLDSYKHLEGIDIDNSNFSDRRNHWLEFQLKNVSDELVVVIHADGQFLMIDEISFKFGSCSLDNIAVTEYLFAEDIVKDSADKLKKSFIQQTLVDTSELKTNNIYIWDAQIWGKLNLELPASNNSIISIVAVKDEYESFNLGLFSTRRIPVNINIDLKDSNDVMNVRELVSVVASNGEKVWDPLMPVKDNALLLMPGEKQYLWFTVDTSSLGAGSHEFSIVIKDNDSDYKYTKLVNIKVIENKTSLSDAPQVVTWAYSHHVPVKGNLLAAIDDQKRHGVNIYVIHPSKLPEPLKRDKWTDENFTALRNEILNYKSNGLVLLYLGWPQWLYGKSGLELLKEKETIQDWVRLLNKKLSDYGLSNKDWALYPLDEPIGRKMEVLKVVAPWIKDVDDKIQLYANPIQTFSKIPSVKDLEFLNKYIDFWQPNFRLANGSGKSFFSNLKKEWWVYGGPGTPVKAAIPFVYRKLSWDAWKLGANGVGFWSYSDTNKSSAWDDFDGTRADWSVVYESDDGPISSRRWEAFRDGVEDFKLLTYMSSKVDGYYKNKIKRNISSVTMGELKQERVDLIDDYELTIKH